MKANFYFSDKTWEELKEYVNKDSLIILPVGQTEEHGLHLPVESDARIATEVAREIAEEVENDVPVLVMPTVWAGYSPNAMNLKQWPGTIQVRISVVIEYIYDITASLVKMGFKKIVILDAHGQHAPILNIVTKRIADEFDVYPALTSPLTMCAKEFNEVRKSERGGVLHACEYETSLMMLFTKLVKMDKLVNNDKMRYHSDFVAGDAASGGQKVTWSTWGLQESKTGTYGDPTVASIDTAKVCVSAMRKNYRKFLLEYYNFKR
jgi:creatinine amidohydrolase